MVGKNKLIEVHLQRDAGKKEGKKKNLLNLKFYPQK